VRFSRKRQNGSAPIFFQGLEENTCSLHPALKSNAPGLLALYSFFFFVSNFDPFVMHQ